MKVVILDTESTSYAPNATWGKLIEISAIRMDLDSGEIIDSFDELINPGISIPKKIVDLTGITDELVKDKERYQTILKNFKKYVGNDVLVMHNAVHDINYLNYFAEKLGFLFDNKTICTLENAKRLIPKDCSDGQYKLEILAKKFDIKDENHHRAMNDVYVTSQLLLKLKELGELIIKEPKIKQEEIFGEKNFEITKVSPWQKTLNSGTTLKRIYVSLKGVNGSDVDYATVFYDFDKKEWGIKEDSGAIANNLLKIEEKTLMFLNKSEDALNDFNNFN